MTANGLSEEPLDLVIRHLISAWVALDYEGLTPPTAELGISDERWRAFMADKDAEVAALAQEIKAAVAS